jgi:hypothetical protein
MKREADGPAMELPTNQKKSRNQNPKKKKTPKKEGGPIFENESITPTFLLRLINSFSYDVWIWRCRNE